MENPQTIKFFGLTIFSALLIATPVFVYAYDDKTTHQALTEEIIKLFNINFQNLHIANEDAEYVIKGSKDEDAFGRWMRHYYDPIYHRGLQYAGTQWQSSKEWAGDTIAQATYRLHNLPERPFYGKLFNLFSSDDDYSWERAIYDYAWGSHARGLEALGHILHLLEDASVPDHTRNDPHPALGKNFKEKMGDYAPEFLIKFLDSNHDTNASPYESFAVFLRGSLHTADELKNENPAKISSMSDYIEQVARYSNENFFSEDTIFSNNYKKPLVAFEKLEELKNDKRIIFGYTQQNSRLVGRYEKFYWHPSTQKQNKFFIDDPENRILTDYWSLLSKQAVLHGAGMVKLFFDEVAKERKTKMLYAKNRSWFGKKIDTFKHGAFGTASILYGSSITLEDLDNDSVPPPPAPGTKLQNQKDIPGRTLPLPVRTLPVQTPRIITPTPPPELVLAPPPAQNKKQDSDTLISGGGSQQVPPPPPPPATSSTPSPDTTAPSVSFVISACDQSLASDGCVLATSSVALAWSSSDADLNYYQLACTAHSRSCANFTTSTTTATSTIYTIPNDNTIYTFKVKAVDTAGNESAYATKDVEIAMRPIVINEIAWAGTSASRAEDEWIELYNTTSKSIPLSGWVLRSSTDTTPSISLSGSIAANRFAVLERTDNSTISDITALQTYTGSLVNSGETLELLYASTTIDQTPTVNACSGWCGGSNVSYYTMERYDPWTTGTSTSNWTGWQGFLANGLNADGQQINGTPGKRNSVNYFIDTGGTSLSQSKTLTRSHSPYIVPNGEFTIGSGKTLTLEPGVIIKIMAGGFITVNGIINAQGTAANQIVFTSFNDDEYGGDTNATTTAPAQGDWRALRVLADGSIFDHTVFRYGGTEDLANLYWANIRVENASTTIKNSTIEQSYTYGAYLKNATGTFENNTVRFNNRNIPGQTRGTGVVVTGGSIPITNNTISQNSVGILVTETNTSALTSNTITENSYEAVHQLNTYSTFSQNSASSNGTNGILLEGTIEQNYTLSANLPYVIKTVTYTISSGKILTIPAGTIIKLQGTATIAASGKIVSQGTSASKVVITSLHDDDCGISSGCGDTDATSTAPQAGDWRTISFNSGSASSTITHTIIRYGGTTLTLDSNRGAVRIVNSSIEIDNSTIEKSYFMGIALDSSSATRITNSFIRDHQYPPAPESVYGLYFTASSTPYIQNTRFSNNRTHIFNDSTSSYTDGGGNIFE